MQIGITLDRQSKKRIDVYNLDVDMLVGLITGMMGMVYFVAAVAPIAFLAWLVLVRRPHLEVTKENLTVVNWLTKISMPKEHELFFGVYYKSYPTGRYGGRNKLFPALVVVDKTENKIVTKILLSVFFYPSMFKTVQQKLKEFGYKTNYDPSIEKWFVNGSPYFGTNNPTLYKRLSQETTKELLK